MAWELNDELGNRQGLTIAEHGEPGGPGMGGCPNGPLQSGPPAPSNKEAVDLAAGGIKVNWTPAVAIPGTPAILGYRVTAVAKTAINGEQVEIGRRIMNPSATSTTVTGVTSADYDVNVVSLSDVGETFPVQPVPVKATDTTAPTVSASPAGGSYQVAQQVTLEADEFGSDIYYTLDGTNPITGGQPTASAVRFTAPIAISAATTLKYVAFDPSNNVSSIETAEYTITNDPVAVPPAISGASVGLGKVTLNWAASDPGIAGATILDYQVKVFADADAAALVDTLTTNGPGTSITIGGLTGDTPYFFTVSAKNSVNQVFGSASAVYGPVTPQGAIVAIAGPDQPSVTRGTLVSLSGAGSTQGAEYKWTQLVTGAAERTVMPAGVDKVNLDGRNKKNASFTLPFFKFGMNRTPLTFELMVTTPNGSITDQVVITPRADLVSIGGAKWKAGDFRVSGAGSIEGAVITVRSANGTAYGTAVVTAGAWELRLRNGVPATNPGTVYADSDLGGTAGPFTVTNG